MDSDGIGIYLFKHEDLPDVLPELMPYLEKGMEGNHLDRRVISAKIEENKIQVWGIYDEDFQPFGAFLTYIDSHGYVMVCGLGGDSVKLWINKMVEILLGFARHVDCGSIRFIGSRGYERLITFRKPQRINKSAQLNMNEYFISAGNA